jgi:hypothetical protein
VDCFLFVSGRGQGRERYTPVLCTGQPAESAPFSDIIGTGKWYPGNDWIVTVEKAQIYWRFEPAGQAFVYRVSCTVFKRLRSSRLGIQMHELPD